MEGRRERRGKGKKKIKVGRGVKGKTEGTEDVR